MKFSKLQVDEFNKFVSKNSSHYTQSVAQYEYRNKFQKDVHLVGIKNDNGEILAACLLTEARCLKFFKYFYTHRGPVMNYNDGELVRFFYEHLTKYLKKHGCLYVLTDPYLMENIRDGKGNIVKHFNNELFMKIMDNLGYKHQGFSIGYSQTSQIRWLSVLDLKDKSEAELLKEMDYQTRRNIKKTYEMGVQVRTLSIDETPLFFKLFKMAEEKHGFKFRDLEYFKKMQKMYGKKAFLKLSYIDLNNYVKELRKKSADLKKDLQEFQKKLEENPNSKKSKSKVSQIEEQLDSNYQKMNDAELLMKTDGDVLNLAAALYLYNEHEVYYLSSGSNPKYNAFMGAYRLQWEMIKFAKTKGIDRYNFYGITGDFSNDSEDFGVQKFKEGFNAHVEEYIGDFIKPVKPFFYSIYKFLKK